MRIKRLPAPDSTLSLLREGYLFISNRRAALHCDVFETRLLLRRVICIGGPGSAELFYDADRMKRSGVTPGRVQRTLLGKGGIHGLDGPEHAYRKRLFMGLMKQDSVERFRGLVREAWHRRLGAWQHRHIISLFEEAKLVLTEAICAWAGLPLAQQEVPEKAAWFFDMVDAFGCIGPRHWRGIIARKHAESWAQGIIEDVREGQAHAADGTALRAIADMKNARGMLANPSLAAVELLNATRPVIAPPTS
jgi:fatty-acid peroxygenase